MKPQDIKFIRETFGLSQRALAKALNVGPYTVSRWESGQNSPTGLPLEVLQGLYNTAVEVDRERNEQRRAAIAGLVTLGIGALIFYLLSKTE